MRRRVFDQLASIAGGAMVVILLVAGSLLMWGYSFANSTVHDQLAQQQIFFPTNAQLAQAKPGTEVTPGMIPYLQPYAGQQVLDGAQAETYANHYIAVHLSEMPYHGVYSQISTAARANPTNAKLQALVQTSFQGTTLRGLLLEAYGFWTFGQIAFWAGIASFAGALVMAVLVGLGIWHSRRTSGDAEMFTASSSSGRHAQAA